MGVKIEFTGFCKRCDHADLELDTFTFMQVDGIDIKQFQIKCNHKEACRQALLHAGRSDLSEGGNK